MDAPCRYFRARSMFVPGQETLVAPDPELITSNYCWCLRTMAEVGIDDDLVSLELCSCGSRSCYRET